MTLQVSLSWGKEHIPVEIPDEHVAGYIHPESKSAGTGCPITPEILQEKVLHALTHPLDGGISLAERVRGKKVAVFMEDDSREQPHRLFLENLALHLTSARHIHFLLTTGTHNPSTVGNQAILKAMQDIGSQLKVPFDVTANYTGIDSARNVFINVGTTQRGTPVRIMQEALDAQVHVIVASLKFHYFAGYSGKHKHAIPSVSHRDCIEANHKLALLANSAAGNHPLHADTTRQKNPLAEDMEEAQQMTLHFPYQNISQREVYVLASVTSQDSLIWMGAGQGDVVMREGIRMLDRYFLFTAAASPYVLFSSGGSPHDDTFYQAHCGFELCKDVFAKEVLWLAACTDGVAPTPGCERQFFERLGHYGNRFAEGRKDILEHYTLHAQKVYKYFESFAYLLEQQQGHIYLYSTLPAEKVRYAHMVPVSSSREIQQIIDRWLASEPKAKILVIDGANKIHVRRK